MNYCRPVREGILERVLTLKYIPVGWPVIKTRQVENDMQKGTLTAGGFPFSMTEEREER